MSAPIPPSPVSSTLAIAAVMRLNPKPQYLTLAVYAAIAGFAAVSLVPLSPVAAQPPEGGPDAKVDVKAASMLRTWTAISGHKVEAEFLEVVDNHVRLAPKAGGTMRIELSKLIPADQSIARNWGRRAQMPGHIFLSPELLTDWETPLLTAAPSRLRLNRFYKKHVSFGDIAIVSSEQVGTKAVKSVHYWLQLLLSKRPDLARELALANVRVAVMGKDEVTTDLPEYSKATPVDYWKERTRSSKATADLPVLAVAEENLLGLKDDRYGGEQMLVHELAHTIHEIALARRDPTFDQRLRSAYAEAMQKGRWQKTHMTTNHGEYFAEGAQIWFHVNGTVEKANGVHGPVGTRDELKRVDPKLAKLLESVFP